MKFLHILNPFKSDPDRDVFVSQPIAFESIKRAKLFSDKDLEIELLATVFKEDEEVLPRHFTRLDDLEDYYESNNQNKKKYPFIRDVLDRAYKFSENADYIIHSETDISVMPYFYNTIHDLINNGHDAIIINTRIIPNKYKNVNQLNLMWSEVGEKHPGWDCFVFNVNLYKRFKLGKTIVGVNSVGKMLYINLRYHAKKFIEIKNSHLTFHIGKSESLLTIYDYKKYPFWVKCNKANEEEVLSLLNEIKSKNAKKEIGWINEMISDTQIRIGRYTNAMSDDNNQRHFGYWFFKKIKKFLNFSS
tara:strand:+ start:458 stop:1366 length:909 start_codon:yes stop_codon:yes gene_type:complete